MTRRNTFSKMSLATLATAAVLATGCASPAGGLSTNQANAGIGAGIGALAGLAIGQNTTGALIGAGVGAAGGYIWSQHMEQKRQQMLQATAGTGVEVTRTQDNQLKMAIPSDISFDTGSSALRPNMQSVLTQFANGLAAQPNTTVRVIGHTDSTGTDAINNPLSVDRAQSARNFLVSHGIAANRISIEGMGSRQPVADNSTDAGRAKNRRVEVYLGETAQVAQR